MFFSNYEGMIGNKSGSLCSQVVYILLMQINNK